MAVSSGLVRKLLGRRMKSGMENLQARSELSPVGGNCARERQPEFKEEKLRINISWREAGTVREAHGLQSRQYLEKVLSVLIEELAYFSFIAGIYHSDGGSDEGMIERLNGKIQESILKISRVEERLENAPDGCRPAGVRPGAALAQLRFLPGRLGNAEQNPTTELAAVEARCEEVDWEYGPVFFNKSCIGIIDGYCENRVEGLEQAEAVKSELERKRRKLARQNT